MSEERLKTALSEMEQLKFDMENFGEEKQPNMEIAIEAIKKQIPKMVVNPKFIKKFPFGIRVDCPYCGSKNLSSANTNYCNSCGQRLEFGNPDTLIQNRQYVEDSESDKVKDLKCELEELKDKTTNADKIRNMSVEMLTKLIENPNSFFSCNKCPYEKERGSFCTVERCFPYIKKWLESEAE